MIWEESRPQRPGGGLGTKLPEAVSLQYMFETNVLLYLWTDIFTTTRVHK